MTGNIFRLLDAGMAFCFDHLALSGRVVGLLREERLEVPVAALREALVNALAHRLYVRRGTSVSLAIYDDRVEIANPGAFPPGRTSEDFEKGTESEPRNPVIARVLYLRKMLESWGRGIKLMVDECAKAGLPKPLIESDGRFVRVVFARPPRMVKAPEVAANTAEVAANNPEMALKFQEVALKPREVASKIPEVALNGAMEPSVQERVRKLCETLLAGTRADIRRNADATLVQVAQNDSVTLQAIVEKTGLPLRTIQNAIALLKRRGIMSRAGSTRRGRWVVHWQDSTDME